jgi:hypothetical protein
MTIRKSLIVAGAVVGFLPLVPAWAADESKAGLSIADSDAIYVDARSFKVVTGHTNGDASAMVRKSGARELGPAAILFRKGDKLYLATDRSIRRDYGGSENRDYGGSENRDYGGSENRDYGGSENRDYGGSENRDYGGSENRSYGGAPSRQANQRPSNNRRDYGGSENRDYGGSENRDYGGSENRDYGGSENRSYGGAPSRQANQRPSNNRRDYGGGYRDYGCGYCDYGGSENRDYGSSENRGQRRTQQSAYDPDYAQYRLRKFFDENWTPTELK